MSDFLLHLLERDRGPAALRPRLPSRYESLDSGAGGGGFAEPGSILADTGPEDTGSHGEVAPAFPSSDEAHTTGPTESTGPTPGRAAAESPPPGARGPHRASAPVRDRTGATSDPVGSKRGSTPASPPERSSVGPGSRGSRAQGSGAGDRPLVRPTPDEGPAVAGVTGITPGRHPPSGFVDSPRRPGRGAEAAPPALVVPEAAPLVGPAVPRAPTPGTVASPDRSEPSSIARPGVGQTPGDAGAAPPVVSPIRPRESATAQAPESPPPGHDVEGQEPIRIRIGRVEVRAAPQPPRSPAPAPPPLRRPPFSLEDYLKQRSEGRR